MFLIYVNKMICRLCFCESSEFLLIFGEDHLHEESRIAKIIAEYLHIELQIEDEISNKICNDCWKHLDDFHKFYLLIVEKQQTTTTTKITIVKCDVYEDSTSTFPDASLFEDDTKNVSLFEQPIAGLSNENLLLEIQEFEASIAQSSSDESNAISETISKEEQKKTIQTNRCKRLRSENPQCNDKIQKANKSPVNSHSGTIMREHDAYIAENVTLFCCICTQTLKDFGDLKRHFRKEHNCRGYVICCNNRYSKRTPYVDHLKLHNNPELFKCKECDKVLANRNSYQNHMFSCHPSEESLIFECSMCTKKFAKQYILDYHMATHRKEKKYSCDLCEKSFRSNAVLKDHQKRVHFSAMKMICDSCGKSFKCKQSFQIHHQNVHQDVKLPEAQCQICGRWLKDERSLYKHMYKHRDESSGRKFVCNICGTVKQTKQTLNSHIRYHHPAKMHKCTLCEKEFKRMLALEEHMATHTGQALYTCSFCPKTFKSHANMHNHKKKAHPHEWVRKYSQPSRIAVESSSDAMNDEKSSHI